MHHDEQDEQPGEDVVNITNHGKAAHKVLYGAKNFIPDCRESCMITGAHQNQAGDADDENHQQTSEICQGLQGTVKGLVFRAFFGDQQVKLNLMDEVFDVGERQEILPIRMEP